MLHLTLGLGLPMTVRNDISLYSKLKTIVIRHTNIETSLKTQQAGFRSALMSRLYPIQRLITYPVDAAVEVFDTSSTEAEAVFFSRSAWSSASEEETTSEPVEDQADWISQWVLEEQYLILTEDDCPDYEIWNDMLRSQSQALRSLEVSTVGKIDDLVEVHHWIDGFSCDPDSGDNDGSDCIISSSSSEPVTSQRARNQSGSSATCSDSSGSSYSEKDHYQTPYQMDLFSSLLEVSFDSLVLREHEPVALLEWIRKADEPFE